MPGFLGNLGTWNEKRRFQNTYKKVTELSWFLEILVCSWLGGRSASIERVLIEAEGRSIQNGFGWMLDSNPNLENPLWNAISELERIEYERGLRPRSNVYAATGHTVAPPTAEVPKLYDICNQFRNNLSSLYREFDSAKKAAIVSPECITELRLFRVGAFKTLIEINEFRKTYEAKLLDLGINIEELKASSISKAYKANLGNYLDQQIYGCIMKIRDNFDVKSNHTELTQLAHKLFREEELMSPDFAGRLTLPWFDNSNNKSS